MRSLRLSLGLLTAIPVRRVDPDVATARNAMLLAPIAALLAAAPGAVLLAVLDGPPLVAAGLAVTSLALMTNALHWDGLADTADGLAVPRGRGDPLEVMRRSDLGPSGALAIGMTLLLQVAALAALVQNAHPVGEWLLVVAASRAALPIACMSATRPARPDGLGALVIGAVPRSLALIPAGVVAAVGVPFVASPLRVAAAVVATVAVALLIRGLALRRFDGLTGDVLGAVVELSATAGLIALCLKW